MGDISEVYGKIQEKKKLEKQLLLLKEQGKMAEKALVDCRVRCQKENLDVKKFESNEFKQFWYKLRGEFEKRQLENAANAAAAMRALHDAQAHAFDVSLEQEAVEKQLEALAGIEKIYEETLAQHLDHLDYSIHRDEILRMQQKIADDGYQLKVLEGAKNLIHLSDIKITQTLAALERVKQLPANAVSVKDEAQVVISLYSECRILFFQLDQELSQVDSIETEEMHFSSRLQSKATDIFYNKHFTEEIDKETLAQALVELNEIQTLLRKEEETLRHLMTEMADTQVIHQEQLEKFIAETTVTL